MKFQRTSFVFGLLTKRFSIKFRLISLALFVLLPKMASAISLGGYLELTEPVFTNGQFQFLFWVDPGRTCVIESSTDLANWTPIATNSGTDFPRAITVSAPNDGGFYRAAVSIRPTIAYAFAATGNISMNGSGNTTDSFNSTDTQFSTNGQYDAAKARTNGDVASLEGTVSLGLHTLAGNLYLGVEASYVSSNSQVLGAIYRNQNLRFPDVLLPPGPPVAAPLVAGTNLLTVSGNYLIANDFDIDVAAGITVTVQALSDNFNSNIRIHGGATNSGTAYVYLCGTSATLAGNVANDASNLAKNLFVFGLPKLTSLIVEGGGNSRFTGVIYAPEAAIDFATGPNSSFVGSCVGRSATVNGHYKFHFDEDLLNAPNFP